MTSSFCSIASRAGEQRERVKQDVLGMLMASGRYKGADAEANAEALSLMVGRLADMAGVDPWEHYARYRLRINNQGGHQVAGQKPNTIDPVSDGLLLDALNGVMPSESAERREEIQRIQRALDEHEVLREKSPSELAAMNRQDIWDMLFPEAVLEQTAVEEGNILESEGFRQWFGGKSIDALEADYAALADDKGRKLTDDGHHIDTDLVRELSPAYRADRSLSGQLHPYASALTKELFRRALERPVREGKSPVVAFLAGGGGSGKSTAGGPVIAAINPDITMDGTLSSLKGAQQNIEASLANGRGVEVVFVYRSPEKSVAGAIGRAISKGRPVPVSALAEAHSQAPENVKALAKEYNGDERVSITAVWNDGDTASEVRRIQVEEIPYVDREQAERIFRDAVESERAAGKLPDKLYSAFSDGSAGRLVREVLGGVSQTRPQQHAGNPLTLSQSPAESGASSLQEAEQIAAERAATERAYGGRAAYDKAKAEGRTQLTFQQWVDVRTPAFKQWFGDWEAVRAQERLDAMEPVEVELPDALKDASLEQLRDAVKARLDALAESGTVVNHPEVGEIGFSKGNNKKVVSTSAVPEKLHAAHDIVRVIESAVHVGSALSGKPDEARREVAYHTLAANVRAAGREFVAVVTVKEGHDGSRFYNTVAVDGGQEKAPAAYPGSHEHEALGVTTAFTGAGDSVLPALRRVNPSEVSKVIDPATGEPLVVYHGTNAEFYAFDRGRLGEGTYSNADRTDAAMTAALGHWFSTKDIAAETGIYSRSMPVFLNIRNPIEHNSLWYGLVEDMAAYVPQDEDGNLMERVADFEDTDGITKAADNYRSDLEYDGRDGIIVESDDEFGGTSFVAFESNQIKSATANNGNYSADADSILEQRKADTPRGQIRFLPERTFSIDLFEGADGSTFMHEAAHFVLEQMQDLAEQSEAVKAELDRVRAWLGNDGGTFTTDEHERFARGFEMYLREGKAPVPGLRRLFERMKNWLMRAYRRALELNVTLNDDIRGVFDRLLASEAEIEAAQRKQGDNPLALSKEARALLKPGQYEKYVEAREDALAEAREALLSKLNAAERRKHEQWWKKELKALVAQKLAEIDASPAGRAQQRMRADKSLRLDKAALVARYGKAWTQESLRALGVYTVKDGLNPETAAMLFGFDSGDALVKALADLPDARARAKDWALSEMYARHGDPMTDGSLPDAAMEAIHGNPRLQLLEKELALLSELAGQPFPPLAVVREYARRKVAGTVLRRLRPHHYLAAERKAARETARALAQGNYAAALAAKRQQAVQAVLYSEARTGSYLMEVAAGEHSPEGPEDMWYLLQGPPKEKE